MNVKHVAKFAGSALGAGSAVRRLSKARNADDRLLMLDAAVSILSALVAVAIVVREIRNDNSTAEIEDGR